VRYKEEDKDAGFYDEEAVAILMLMKEHNQWTPLNVTSIFDYLFSLNENIKKNQKFQKYLSHFRGVRMAAENVRRAAQRGELQSYYPVMKIDPKTNIMHFVTVEDPGIKVYACWLHLVAGPRFEELGVANMERLADIVEAGMGLCYLASVFPVQLHDHLAQPNEMWRMMETLRLHPVFRPANKTQIRAGFSSLLRCRHRSRNDAIYQTSAYLCFWTRHDPADRELGRH